MDSLCEFCRNIPFEQLPSEEELAHAHQPSLAALETSAATCRLCQMILQAISDVRRSIDREVRGMPESRFVMHYPGTDHTGARVTSYFGPAAPFNINQSDGFGRESVPLHTNYTGDVLRPWLFGNWWKIEDFTDDLYSDYSSPQLIGIGVRVSKSPRIHDAEGNSEKEVTYRGSGLRIRVYDDSPGASFIPGRMRTLDCRSSLARRRIHQWLDGCNTHHKCAPVLPVLPTRVLDLGHEPSTQGIKLVETEGRTGRYIALSHCWGTSHRITTTQSTLEAMKHGIPLSELPKTFREAVLISKDLGVSYLWIDSLCIIQDSIADWEQEASRMGHVYANSYITIAASSSVDDSGGCLPTIQTRSDMKYISPDAESMHLNIAPDLPPYIIFLKNDESPAYISRGERSVQLDIKTRQTDSKLSDLFVTPEWMPGSSKRHPRTYSIGNFGALLDPVADEPLNARAWTLQERILAPRVLHYGSRQMFWECKEGLLAEDGCRYTSVAYREAFPTMQSIVKGQLIPYHLHGLPPQCALSILEPTYLIMRNRESKNWILRQHGAHFHHQETLYTNILSGRWNKGWIELVQDYSKRKLTRSEDKLPALAGLARLLAQQTGDTYFAGVWGNHLPEDLFWRVYAREEPTPLGNPDDTIQACYGAILSSVSKPATYRAPTWSWASIDANVLFIQMNFDHIVSECLECHVEPSGSDIFGKVKGGYIQIKAPLIPLHPLRPSITPLEPYGVAVEVSVSAGIAPGIAYLDTRTEFPTSFRCFALFLDWSNALVLARLKNKHDGEDEYHRIGIARFIWTQSQRDEYYRLGDVPPPPDRRGVFYRGPIAEGDEKRVVKIV